MTTEIFFRYLHFIGIFGLISTLVAEHLFLKSEMTRAELSRVAKIDAVYGLAAVTLLLAGLTLWFGDVGKPVSFYSKNWIFMTKISLFFLVGLLSIYPTIFFLRNRKGPASDIVLLPMKLIWMIRLELLLLVLIPLLAVLMAKGVGFHP